MKTERYQKYQLLVCRNEKSNKYYFIVQNDKTVEVYYGAIKTDTPHFSYWNYSFLKEAKVHLIKKMLKNQEKDIKK